MAKVISPQFSITNVGNSNYTRNVPKNKNEMQEKIYSLNKTTSKCPLHVG